MILSDFLLCCLFLIAYFIKQGNRDSFITLLCFALTVMYSSEVWFGFWDGHSELETHFYYAVPFMIGFFAIKALWVKISLISYVMLQCLMMFDTLLSGQTSFLYEHYLYLQVTIAICIILSLFKGIRNGKRRGIHHTNRHRGLVDISGALPDLGSIQKTGFRK